MANPTDTITSAGRSAGRAAGDVAGGAGDAISKAAARTREEAEDIWAEARGVARKDEGRDAAVYTAIAATAALGVVELPVAAVAGVGYALFRRRR
ncbi:MAG: hypothetical protein JOZ73_06260 [Solirubrobacterales bacterium]|nr:hypothetical protein [Solirubrobacterales bacterium]